MDILCVIGYGPQVNDNSDRKVKFCKYLEEETQTSRELNCGIIIQIDSNVWEGDLIIPNDPNPQNSNGQLLKQFL